MSDPTYTSIYAFGDSLSDAGNASLLTNSKLLTSAAVGAALGFPGESLGEALGDPPEPIAPPYASEIYGSVTADVFSNGPVWVQDLSQDLGLGELAPSGIVFTDQEAASAFDVSVSEVDTRIFPLLARLGILTNDGTYAVIANGGNGTGSATDFAIGGSVTGPTGENAGAAVALTDLAAQYQTFLDTVGTPDPNALYTVWSGSNDVLDLLESGLDPAAMAADIAQSVTQELDFIGTLISGGARNLLVVTVPDLGLAPAGQADAATASALALSYNAQLLAGLVPLEQTATITIVDSYGLLDSAATDPAAYGLTDVTDPLWTGNYEGQNGTLAATGTAADGYLFFDQLHPTEQGHELIADGALAALGIPCYVSGTRLETPNGPRSVETLRAGDLVRTAGGDDRPVIWIGCRRMDLRTHPSPLDGWPVCFRAGALADGVPQRDLLVSPKHAMFLDGVLVAAELLVNGVSVVRREDVQEPTYFHVELENHDILLAEGAPSESFNDLESRMMFENARDAPARCGGGRTADCAPRVEDGEQLEAVRRRIAARAGLAGNHVGDAAVPGPLEGRIEALDHHSVSGWAFDPARPHTPVRLQVLVDGGPVAVCVANRLRPLLRGRCGFTVSLTRSPGDGPLSPTADHEVEIRRLEDGVILAARRLAAEPLDPGPLEGFVDVCDTSSVEGWALDAAWPGVPVRLEICDGAGVLATFVANRYRLDLERAGKGGGWCSFAFRFDAPLPDAGRIRVRRAGDHSELAQA